MRRIFMVMVVAAAVLSPPAHAAGCRAGARDPLARVQLFRDGDCRGSSVAI